MQHETKHATQVHRAPRDLLVHGLLASLLACAAACSGSSSGSSAPVPDFSLATFANATLVNNPLFPLVPGTITTLQIEPEDGEPVEEDAEVVVVEVLDTTRTVLGVTCVVVRDRVYEGELLIEDTRDFYAQDDAGNVWYMGEEVDNYEYDDDGMLLGVDHEGAWEAGLDVLGTGELAQPGYVMLASPAVGDRYKQEFYPGEAEDEARVLAVDAPVELSDGSSFTCLQTRDTALSGPAELKYYAPGVGFVLETDKSGDERLELRGTFQAQPPPLNVFLSATFGDPSTIDHPLLPFPVDTTTLFLGQTPDGPETTVIDVLDQTRTVMGIACAVVRDRVFADELLVEDTEDWYAQDDDGNVWYMGEAVLNYEYDDDGNLLGTDSEGSWEAGLDVNGSGSNAEPGYLVRAMPVAGESYYQEYYAGEAEDQAHVVRLDATVELDDGSTLTGCLQTLEWNPFAPGTLEYKYYSPGRNVVLEETVSRSERTERKGTFVRGPAAIPDFSSAAFTDPTTIDHPFFPLTPGASFDYTSETEDGTETTLVEVLPGVRMVMGIDCVVVRDRVYLDGLLIEDTDDWYAQDDAGNVWYMGEESESFEYDDDDNLIGTSTEGSWEAGLDVASTGSNAEPGFLLPASPTPGTSYHQEFYEDEAEDLALVVAADASVELEDGTTYDGCLQTLEWNPLAPETLEYKFYAPGVGLVLEEDLVSEARVELVP